MRLLRLQTFLALFFISFLLGFLDSRKALEGPKSVGQAVVAPVKYALYSAKLGAQEAFSFLTFWKSGEARIRHLELRVAELAGADARVKALEEENRLLRQQLGAPVKSVSKLLPATVLGVNRYLEIAIGSNEGVKEGMAVIYENNLLGKVVKVSPRISYVQVLSDPQSKVPVKVGSSRGIVIGQFNSAIILDRVVQTENLSGVNYIFTSGEDKVFPPDLVVGRVGEILSKETDLFQTARVVPLVNPGNLKIVFVVAEKK